MEVTSAYVIRQLLRKTSLFALQLLKYMEMEIDADVFDLVST